MPDITRRLALQAPLGALTLHSSSSLWAQTGKNPRFFLQIIIEEGLDSLYLFDARPRSMTAAGRIANYATADAVPWEDQQGGHCLVARVAAEALQAFKSRLAIINGVVMPTGFEGHVQNLNSLLSGNPFGGKYFGAQLAREERPISFVELGSLATVSLSNRSQALQLEADTAVSLANKVASLGGNRPLAPWQARALKRAERCGHAASMLAQGCFNYTGAIHRSQSLAGILANARPDLSQSPSLLEKSVQVASTYFRAGLSQACLLTTHLTYSLDTHGTEQAQKSEKLVATVLQDLVGALRQLQNTPFDASQGLSMLDVTTVMISSEFSRTHGQLGKSVEATGTDHNPLANMVLLLGQGIRGNSIVGATDLAALNDDLSFARVSGAHREMDAALLKRMGRPFDFVSQTNTSALPEHFVLDDYISAASVTNTLLASFGVPSQHWLSNSQGRSAQTAKVAPILSRVLS